MWFFMWFRQLRVAPGAFSVDFLSICAFLRNQSGSWRWILKNYTELCFSMSRGYMLSRVHQKTASQSPVDNVDSSEANMFFCRRAVSGNGRNWRRKARSLSWRIISSNESYSSHGTVNEMMSDVEEKKIWIFLVVLLSSIYQFQIIFGLKSSEEEVLLSWTCMDLSVLRQSKV